MELQPLSWHLRTQREPTDEEQEVIDTVMGAAQAYLDSPEEERRAFIRSVRFTYVSGHDIFTATRFRFGTVDWAVLQPFVEACAMPDPFLDEAGTMPILDTNGTLWPREMLHEHEGKIVRRGDQSWLVWPVIIENELTYPHVTENDK